MGGRPAMPAWPGRPAGRIFFLRGPARRPPSGSIWRPRPLKKKIWPAGRPGRPKMGKDRSNQGKNRPNQRKNMDFNTKSSNEYGDLLYIYIYM